MIARVGGGKILNIGSLISEPARATVAPYTAANGGVKMLTRSMAAEWAQHDIQVNAIGSGYIVAEMNCEPLDDTAFDAWVKNSNPSRRWGAPEELVGAKVSHKKLGDRIALHPSRPLLRFRTGTAAQEL